MAVNTKQKENNMNDLGLQETKREATMPRIKMAQCEGWSKTGGFQMGGTGRWEQCKSDAAWSITFQRASEKKQTLPACESCMKKVIEGKHDPVTVLKLVRLQNPKQKKQT